MIPQKPITIVISKTGKIGHQLIFSSFKTEISLIKYVHSGKGNVHRKKEIQMNKFV